MVCNCISFAHCATTLACLELLRVSIPGESVQRVFEAELQSVSTKNADAFEIIGHDASLLIHNARTLVTSQSIH